MNWITIAAWVLIVGALIGIAIITFFAISDSRHKRRLQKMREETNAQRQQKTPPVTTDFQTPPATTDFRDEFVEK